MRRPILTALLAAIVLLPAGCAATDTRDAAPGPSASAIDENAPARIGLAPEYRVFYDELRDDGDWTLIEPYGWVFRPRVNFVAWRPYQDGWWEPSEQWGWVWNTYEPFGWVTYHYGAWFYDEYQGWVWQPGPVWGPAWVAWVDAGDFVGWAPLPPRNWDAWDHVPDGIFTYAPARQFATRDLPQHAMYLSALPAQAATPRAIVNVGHANGGTFNRGPDPDVLRQRGMGAALPFDEKSLGRVKFAAPPAHADLTESDLQDRTTRLANAGVLQLRKLREQGMAPPSSGYRPGSNPTPASPLTRPHPTYAPADTSHAHHAPKPGKPADADKKKHPKPKKPAQAAADSTRSH